MIQTKMSQPQPVRGNELQKLVNRRYFKKYQSLNLNYFVDEWKSVIQFQDWSTLKALQLQQCAITLAEMPLITTLTMKDLRFIDLSYNLIGSRGVKMMLSLQMPLLQALALMGCHSGNEGSKHLSKGNWKNMKQIWLTKNYICHDGNLSIFNSNWGQLKNIQINKITRGEQPESYHEPITLLHLILIPQKRLTMNQVVENQDIFGYIQQIWNVKESGP